MRKFIYIGAIIFILVLIYQLYLSCFFEVIHLQKEDASQEISVFSGVRERYVVPGYHEKIPKRDYLRLDVRRTIRIYDVLYIKWDGNRGWQMVVCNSSVIENYLDSNAYHFENHLPTIEYTSIPTEESFNNKESGSFDFVTRTATRKTDNLKISYSNSIWKF